MCYNCTTEQPHFTPLLLFSLSLHTYSCPCIEVLRAGAQRDARSTACHHGHDAAASTDSARIAGVPHGWPFPFPKMNDAPGWKDSLLCLSCCYGRVPWAPLAFLLFLKQLQNLHHSDSSSAVTKPEEMMAMKLLLHIFKVQEIFGSHTKF